MAHPSDPRLLVLHGLRLKGFAEPPVVAELYGLDLPSVEAHLVTMAEDELVLRRDGRISGWALTATGRKEDERLVAEELEEIDAREEIDGCYRRFLALNQDMLSICTDWQMRGVGDLAVVNDHTDQAYDQKVVDRLVGLHDQARPIVADLRTLLVRFAPYGNRLRNALERLVGGERDWFTKPVIDSYHTVWFEMHEDLLTTLGLDRSKEEAP
jgi:hypothetical protein